MRAVRGPVREPRIASRASVSARPASWGSRRRVSPPVALFGSGPLPQVSRVRRNDVEEEFSRELGVVVDVCSAHGLWFDAGELATILEFAETGALAKAEHDIVERAAARERLDAWGKDLRAVGPRHYISGVSGGFVGPIDALADIAHVIPGIDPDDD
jgi:Zn-finger nucleic acid-binding protein